MTKKRIAFPKVLYAFIVFALVWSVFAAGSVPVASAQTTGSSEAVVSLSVSKQAFGAAESIVLHTSITNPHAEAIEVLKWYIPADGMEEPLLSVTREGEPVSYLGPLFKRRPPTEQDYLTLQPGETVSGSLDLSAYYDLTASGNYTVSYSVNSPELYARRDKELRKMSGKLVSNEIRLFIEGRSKPSLKAITPEAVSGPTSFTSCSPTRQSQLLTARTDASNYSADALAYFNANIQGNRYITWFGAYLLSRYNTVKSHFTNITSAMDTASVHFDCTCTDPNVYAYVYPSQPYNIYLCGAFWPSPATGSDSKAGTLIHEMSHFTVVAGTQDWVYGKAASQNLAITDPAKAVTNADNHEYFAENTPPIVDSGDSYESDNSSNQAKTISVGTPQTHSIFPATDIDWVKFQLTVPSAVVLETTGTANGDTRMWLYDSSLQQVRFSDNEGVGNYSYINTCDAANLAAGTYYVKVDESAITTKSPPIPFPFPQGTTVWALRWQIRKLMPSLSFQGQAPGKVSQAQTMDPSYWFPWYNNLDLDTQLRFGLP
jgi:peptidyl-Lys metalloendopeptidase